MDKRLLRYAGGGGAISLLACGLLCMVLGALAGGDVAGLVACGVIFTLPGVVFGCAYGLYEALRRSGRVGRGILDAPAFRNDLHTICRGLGCRAAERLRALPQPAPAQTRMCSAAPVGKNYHKTAQES